MKLRRWHVICCFTVIAVAALVLKGMGRSFWCSCGQFNLWSSEVQSMHNSQHLIDQYTFTHILHGVALYAVLWLILGRLMGPLSRGVLAIGLESFWEVLENTSTVIDKYREVTVSYGYYGDSIFNSIGDIFACGLGYALAMWVPVWVSAVGFFAIEGILLWWIRDSLLLNLLMLLWPIEAIKNWQLGDTATTAGVMPGILHAVSRKSLHRLRRVFRDPLHTSPEFASTIHPGPEPRTRGCVSKEEEKPELPFRRD